MLSDAKPHLCAWHCYLGLRIGGLFLIDHYKILQTGKETGFRDIHRFSCILQDLC